MSILPCACMINDRPLRSWNINAPPPRSRLPDSRHGSHHALPAVATSDDASRRRWRFARRRRPATVSVIIASSSAAPGNDHRDRPAASGSVTPAARSCQDDSRPNQYRDRVWLDSSNGAGRIQRPDPHTATVQLQLAKRCALAWLAIQMMREPASPRRRRPSVCQYADPRTGDEPIAAVTATNRAARRATPTATQTAHSSQYQRDGTPTAAFSAGNRPTVIGKFRNRHQPDFIISSIRPHRRHGRSADNAGRNVGRQIARRKSASASAMNGSEANTTLMPPALRGGRPTVNNDRNLR